MRRGLIFFKTKLSSILQESTGMETDFDSRYSNSFLHSQGIADFAQTSVIMLSKKCSF